MGIIHHLPLGITIQSTKDLALRGINSSFKHTTNSSICPSPVRPPICPRSHLGPPLWNRRISRKLIPLLAFGPRTSQIAQSKRLAETLARIHAIHRIHPEDNMPHILHHSPADLIIQLRLFNPVPYLLVKNAWSRMDPISRNGELARAMGAHDFGDGFARK